MKHFPRRARQIGKRSMQPHLKSFTSFLNAKFSPQALSRIARAASPSHQWTTLPLAGRCKHSFFLVKPNPTEKRGRGARHWRVSPPFFQFPGDASITASRSSRSRSRVVSAFQYLHELYDCPGRYFFRRASPAFFPLARKKFVAPRASLFIGADATVFLSFGFTCLRKPWHVGFSFFWGDRRIDMTGGKVRRGWMREICRWRRFDFWPWLSYRRYICGFYCSSFDNVIV